MFKQMFFLGIFSILLLIACSKSTKWQPARSSLQTRWAKDVSPQHVWPEYPRPAMERKEWFNLNGLWEYAVRPVDQPQPQQFDGSILVPFPVESALSGVGKMVREKNKLWYRRWFQIPAKWQGKRIFLRFEAVDWETKVWLNGNELGVHRGGYDPFNFEISKFLRKAGKQELVVSVWDPTDAGYQPRGKQVNKPKGIYYTPTTGIWQTVWLEPVAETFIENFQLFPDIDRNRLTIAVTLNGQEKNVKIGATALDRAGNRIAEMIGDASGNLVLNIANPELWSPAGPYLYGLKLRLLRGDEPVDQVISYFGMRKISLGKDERGITRLMLNNRFLFQIGPLDQGFWPDGLYTPPTDAAMKYDLEVLKKMGFNMLRKHVKVEPRRFYTWCDKIGLLVWQDMPSGDRSIGHRKADMVRSKESAKQYELELNRMIETKFNHPCVVMWVPFNEGWGQFDTPRIVDFIRNLDPTRLVDNASGWTDRGVGDVVDIHRYPGPDAPQPEMKRAAVLGEFGGLGFNTPGHTWKKEGWGYAVMQDREALAARYENLLQGVHRFVNNPGLSAAVYTQTTDIETENNGLVTYDREIMKIDPEIVALANQGYLPPRLEEDTQIFIDKYEVKLASPAKDAQIFYSTDDSEPSQQSKKYFEPFTIGSTITIKARAFWPNGKASRVNRFIICKVEPRKAAAVSGLKANLKVDIYAGQWKMLPDFTNLTPAAKKTAGKMDLAAAGTNKNFALKYTGFIKIPQTGVYIFYVTSDDGSRLLIGEEVVVNNDGVHGAREKNGAIALEKGFHPLELLYFQDAGGRNLQVRLAGPGLKKQEIPSSVLSHR